MKSLMLASVLLALSVSACSQPTGSSVSKGENTDDLFQEKSIARVGLVKTIALTFDDGPSAAHTPELLDILKREGIKASFFLNGKNVPGNEWILKRMHDEGHVVANHAQTHDHLPTVATKEGMKALYHQVMDTHLLIKPYVQEGGRLYFRAPFGAWKPSFAPYLNSDQVLRDYIGPMFWDIGGEISRDPNTKKILLDESGNPYTAADWDCWTMKNGQQQLTLKQCAGGYHNETLKRNGGIVLMHDKTAQTVQMVEKLISIWKKEGFTFVTLDEIDSLDQYAVEKAQGEK